MVTKLTIEYDGSGFAGCAQQSRMYAEHETPVQLELEMRAKELLRVGPHLCKISLQSLTQRIADGQTLR